LLIIRKSEFIFLFLTSGADYCGRRFATSEDLLIHLKTHTNLSTSDPRALSMLNASMGGAGSAVSSGGAAAAAASALSASARFHPYARHAGIPPPPSSLASSLGLPPGYLNPYASLYPSLFSRPPLI
jgi:hypothetical protein